MCIRDRLWTVARAFAEGRGSSGVFHYAGAPTVSWAGFAEAVLAASALARRPSVRRIASADYPTPARRPANSALDCARIRATYGIEQPDWRASLARVIRELEATA